MNPDLVHSSCSRPAKYHTGPSVKAESLELSVAVLPIGADFANSDFVTDYLDGLLAAHWMSETNKK